MSVSNKVEARLPNPCGKWDLYGRLHENLMNFGDGGVCFFYESVPDSHERPPVQ